MNTGQVLHTKQDNIFVLKYVGEIHYTMSCSLNGFLEKLFNDTPDIEGVLVDLTDAASFDSTNLGLLAKIPRLMTRTGHKANVVLFGPNEELKRTLESANFDKIFPIVADRSQSPAASEPLQIAEPTPDDLAKTVGEAHECLCNISEENRRKYQVVVDMMQAQIAV